MTARIASIDDGQVSLCVGGASVFLYESGGVSISGGPFAGCALNELEPTWGCRAVSFWNWGDNRAGAAQGVDYAIHRPIFKLVPVQGEAS